MGASAGDISERKKEWIERRRLGDLPRASLQSGAAVEPLYTPADTAGLDYERDLGFPGEYPFTRGVYPGMYRKNLFNMRQYSGFGTPEDTNRRWKRLIASGHRAASLAFDLPTHLGYDSDHPLVRDDVGKLGTAIDTLEDMEILFEGLPMNLTPTVFNTAGPAAVIVAMQIAAAQKQGVDPADLISVITNDILSVYLSRGTWIFPPAPSVRLVGDVIEYAVRHIPRFFPVNIQGVYAQAVGARSAEAIGIAFAIARVYIEEGLRRGLAIDEFAPRLSFFIASGTHVFEEAAKFRAARRAWARLMRDGYGARDPRSMRFMVTGVSGAAARREPELNLIRGALGALANALGGVQAMWVQGYDEGYTIPTEKAARYSLRTMQIIAEETDACDTIDPLAGSYYVESITNRLEEEILAAMKLVEDMGGAIEAIATGKLRRHLMKQDFERYRKLATGEIPVVGENKYRTEDEREAPIEIHRPDPAAVERQIERLRAVRARRDGKAVRETLEQVRRAALAGANLIPPLIDAVRAYATLGEITAVLKEVFGTFEEPSIL